MNNYSWFGFTDIERPVNEINTTFNKLLLLYAKALKRYLSADAARNINDILNLEITGLSSEQVDFLDWLKQKGIKQLEKLIRIELPDNKMLKSHIEYDLYILEEEMEEFDYPEDVQAMLISIVNNLPEYIQSVMETAVALRISGKEMKEINKMSIFYENISILVKNKQEELNNLSNRNKSSVKDSYFFV